MPEYDSYDYVIAGAGSAGCVLANRLSADPATRVLLLEAGGPDNAPEIHIPAAFPTLITTERDWGYHTVEQEWLGRPVYVPRGRMLGGSSSMNAMVYIRGNPTDFDGWRDTHGATGWGYRDVLPYFVRAEGNTRLGGPLHGTDGPLRVEDLVYRHELTPAWVESATEWGLKPNDDFNGELSSTGFGGDGVLTSRRVAGRAGCRGGGPRTRRVGSARARRGGGGGCTSRCTRPPRFRGRRSPATGPCSGRVRP
jgi:choline dehydrogenase-like flavoprotein